MSRNTDKIKKILNKYGQEADEIVWTPIGVAFEMCGPEGGWYVRVKAGHDFMAYNIEDLINNIKETEGLSLQDYWDKHGTMSKTIGD